MDPCVKLQLVHTSWTLDVSDQSPYPDVLHGGPPATRFVTLAIIGASLLSFCMHRAWVHPLISTQLITSRSCLMQWSVSATLGQWITRLAAVTGKVQARGGPCA